MPSLKHPSHGRTRELIDSLELLGIDLGISRRVRSLINEIADAGNYVTDVRIGQRTEITICLYNAVSQHALNEVADMTGGEIEHVAYNTGLSPSVTLRINPKYRA